MIDKSINSSLSPFAFGGQQQQLLLRSPSIAAGDFRDGMMSLCPGIIVIRRERDPRVMRGSARADPIVTATGFL